MESGIVTSKSWLDRVLVMAAGDAWALFGDGDDDDVGGGFGSTAAASATVMTSREGAVRGESASTHAFFSAARATWRPRVEDADGDDGAGAGSRMERVSMAMVRSWMDDDGAARRAAVEVRGCKPRGADASDAAKKLGEALAKADWEGAREACEEVKAACEGQLEHGNWPTEGFQDLYAYAHGAVIVTELRAGKRDEEDARARKTSRNDDGTSAASGRGESVSRQTRIGRAALDLSSTAMLMSARRVPNWTAGVIELAESAFGETKASPSSGDDASFPRGSKIPTLLPSSGVPKLDDARAMAVEDANSMTPARFYTDYVSKERPVIIKGLLEQEGWEALEAFASLDVFETHASKLVPIEYGTAFDSHGTGVSTLGAFARDFLAPSNAAHDGEPTSERVAYVSQHQLFHEIPELQSLFTVPLYTLGRISVDTSAINIWLGTAGTRTSIHRDPYLNILCQVSGFKYVRIYGDDATQYLYPDVLREGNANTFTRSPVDPERVDQKAHALAVKAEYVECILRPGDALFMPKNVWHYVRSLTTSVSINFWF